MLNAWSLQNKLSLSLTFRLFTSYIKLNFLYVVGKIKMYITIRASEVIIDLKGLKDNNVKVAIYSQNKLY